MQKVSNLAGNQASRKTVANLFFEMNLNEALNHIFSENEEFKESAKAQDKKGNRLRAYRSRYQKGKRGVDVLSLSLGVFKAGGNKPYKSLVFGLYC